MVRAARTFVRRDFDVQAVIWGMAAVNTDLMRQEMLTKTSSKVNQIIYWGRPMDYRNQTLTPNPDTIYFMAFYDTKAVGPMVLDVPPGGPKGSLNVIDKGTGGKFVILPPGYKDKLPAGHAPLRSDTYSGYALLRVNMADSEFVSPLL